VSDLPLSLPPDAATRLRLAIDRERKIDRALEALGPIAGRDVLVVGGTADELDRYARQGARITPLEATEPSWPVGAGSVDTVLSVWSGFRAVDAALLGEVDRVLRPDGRLLVVHDYGRDDVSRLRGELPEYGSWSRRDGPFLSNGFRVRVIHCFWTFDGLDDARSFLEGAFGEPGAAVAAELRRPRLSYNVAVYHRTRGGTIAPLLGEVPQTASSAGGRPVAFA
jgi:SAM-dependent methyltransferase